MPHAKQIKIDQDRNQAKGGTAAEKLIIIVPTETQSTTLQPGMLSTAHRLLGQPLHQRSTAGTRPRAPSPSGGA